MEKVLIAGNGYAGLSAARTLSGKKGISVTLVSAERGPAYCAHLLPELAAGRKEREALYLLDPGEYKGLADRVNDGTRIERLSLRKRRAVLSTGEEIGFDRALIATGSRASVPPGLREPLRGCRNVITMKCMEDALALRALLAGGARQVAIVGAGRIGVLLAEALRRVPVAVALIEVAAEILPTMLHRDFASGVRAGWDPRSVRVHTGCPVEKVEKDGDRARTLSLSGGITVPCDAVVIATGVEPATGFLEDMPGASEGIPVTSRMETSEPGIYAAGDVVRFETVTGRVEVGQLVLNARKQGEVAARNLAGEKTCCPPMFTGNVVKIDSRIGARIGDTEGTDFHDFRVGRSLARLTLDGREVTGLQFLGDPEDLKGLVPAVLKKFSFSGPESWLARSAEYGLAPMLPGGGKGWG